MAFLKIWLISYELIITFSPELLFDDNDNDDFDDIWQQLKSLQP